jgi:hypothetical protein
LPGGVLAKLSFFQIILFMVVTLSNFSDKKDNKQNLINIFFQIDLKNVFPNVLKVFFFVGLLVSVG